MSYSSSVGDRLRVAVGVLVLGLSPMPVVAASSGDAWEQCRDRVIADLEAKGLDDYGDVGAYIGATGSGALPVVIERCGYRSERVGPDLCDDLYRQVYWACRADGFDGMSMAATSWVAIFDPVAPLLLRLKRVCSDPEPLSRAAFGHRVCGN